METISVNSWTDEDKEIFRRLCDRGDEGSDLLTGSLLGDKLDAFCMLKFSRKPRNPLFLAVHVRHELMAFGGLSPSDISDTSALRCKHSNYRPSIGGISEILRALQDTSPQQSGDTNVEKAR